MTAKVIYKSFDPLDFSVSGFTGTTYTGIISFCIADVQLKLLDLSMGIMPEAGIYGSADIQVMTADVTGMESGKIFELCTMIAPQILEMKKIAQKAFSNGASHSLTANKN